MLRKTLFLMLNAFAFLKVDYTDARFSTWKAKEWYLSGPGSMNVKDAWSQGARGNGIVVGIVDNGIEEGNALRNQLKDELKMNHPPGQADSSETLRDHGTAVASIVAMRDKNSQCGVGIAPEAKIADIALLGGGSTFQNGYDYTVAAFTRNRDYIDIYCNSWGALQTGGTIEDVRTQEKNALLKSMKRGRRGKGNIFLFAAGNGGYNFDKCSYSPRLNLKGSIAIAGIDRNGRQLESGVECSALFAVTPSQLSGNDIVSLRTYDGFWGLSTKCDTSFGHSSAAVPMAAGVIALALSVRNDLTLRDIEHLIARTSNPCSAAGHFSINAAGFRHSDVFGFGLINAAEMVRQSKKWISLPNDSGIECNLPLYDYDFKQKKASFSLRNCRIEYLEDVFVTYTVGATFRGHVTSRLISPAGTPSDILPGRKNDAFPAGLNSLQVKSLDFWGESVSGTWQLSLQGVTDINEVHVTMIGLRTSPPSASLPIQPCSGSPPTNPPTSPDVPNLCTRKSFEEWKQCLNVVGVCRRERFGYCHDDSGEPKNVFVQTEKCPSYLCGDGSTFVSQSGHEYHCKHIQGSSWSSCGWSQSKDCLQTRDALCITNDGVISGTQTKSCKC